MKNLELQGFGTDIAYLEAIGLSKCFNAYAENTEVEDIFEIGFNSNSGYVYIALETGISICCMLGREVEFLVYDSESGEEHFFEKYTDSLKFFFNN